VVHRKTIIYSSHLPARQRGCPEANLLAAAISPQQEQHMNPSIKLSVVGGFLFTLLGFVASGNTSEQKIEAAGKVLAGKVAVGYSDLNLDDPADLQVLLDRVVHAAYEACGGDPKFNGSYYDKPREVLKAYEECRREAVATAIGTIDSPRLSALY